MMILMFAKKVFKNFKVSKRIQRLNLKKKLIFFKNQMNLTYNIKVNWKH